MSHADGNYPPVHLAPSNSSSSSSIPIRPPTRACFIAALDPPSRADSFIARGHFAALRITEVMGDNGPG